MSYRRMLFLAAFTLALLLAACTGGEVPPAAEPTSPYVEPLPSDRAEMQIAAPDGALPCGLGEVDWGYRIFLVDDFPACRAYLPNLSVYCLGGSAEWSDANVDDVEVSTETSTVAFNVRQTGLCGLFPAGQ